MTELIQWAEAALTLSSADECVIICADSAEANLRWAVNRLTTNGQSSQTSATVISIARDDHQTGHAGVVSGPVATAGDLAALVAEADEACREAPAAEDSAPLPDPVVDPDFAEPSERTSIADFAAITAGLGAALAQSRADGSELFGFLEHKVTTCWLLTSTGARRRFVDRMGRIELNAKAADRIGSAWVGQGFSHVTEVDMPALTAEVARRLEWTENRLELPPGRYETLLSPSCVADLMILMYWTMNGADAAQGRNVFAGPTPGTTRIGEQLSDLNLTLSSGPEASSGAPFAIVGASEAGRTSVFDNGADVDVSQWVTDGRLQRLVWTRAAASASGMDFEFACDNLTMTADSTQSLEQMIATTKRGLLVTCLWYIREVDIESLLVTGLTRDGVYLIEDGEIVGMVNNFRFNESPVDLLKRATQASRSEPTLCREWNDWFTHTTMPALRIPDFNMSTVSLAY